MAWQQQITRPRLELENGTILEFDFNQVENSTNRNIRRRAVPGSENPVVQDLGKLPTEFRIRGFIIDDPANTQSYVDIEKFLQATVGIHTFTHPYHWQV